MNQHETFFSKIGFNYLTYFILTLIFQIILLNAINLINPELCANYNVITTSSAIANYILPFPILLFLMKKIPSEKISEHKLDLKTIFLYISITFTLMWIGNILGLLVNFIIGSAMQTTITNPVHELINTQDIWLNLVLVSIMGPIFEEIFMRKLLIDRTIKYGAKVSIVLSAVIFAFMHGNISQFFYALLMGGFLAYVYIETGKITYTIILHMAVNFMGSVVSLFVQESANTITQGTYTIPDLSIVIFYFLFIMIMFFFGVIGLFKLKDKNLKSGIELDKPFKTMFINYGMICFIGFCIILIVKQII